MASAGAARANNGPLGDPMTPQAMLTARFAEVAEALGVRYSFRNRKGRLFYLNVRADDFRKGNQFVDTIFPTAWLTSGGPGDQTYGLPLQDVERIVRNLSVDQAWLQGNGAAALRIAHGIRDEHAFEQLP